jgi:hypothetical protein
VLFPPFSVLFSWLPLIWYVFSLWRGPKACFKKAGAARAGRGMRAGRSDTGAARQTFESMHLHMEKTYLRWRYLGWFMRHEALSLFSRCLDVYACALDEVASHAGTRTQSLPAQL